MHAMYCVNRQKLTISSTQKSEDFASNGCELNKIDNIFVFHNIDALGREGGRTSGWIQNSRQQKHVSSSWIQQESKSQVFQT